MNSKKQDPSFVSKRLESIIKEKNITVAELALISGVNSTTIANILRGKSHNTSAISSIAGALNINVKYLTEKDCTKKYVQIDPTLYGECTNIAINALKKANVQVNANVIKFLQDELYFAHTEVKLPLDQGESFVLGMIHYGLSLGTFIKNS